MTDLGINFYFQNEGKKNYNQKVLIQGKIKINKERRVRTREKFRGSFIQHHNVTFISINYNS